MVKTAVILAAGLGSRLKERTKVKGQRFKVRGLRLKVKMCPYTYNL